MSIALLLAVGLAPHLEGQVSRSDPLPSFEASRSSLPAPILDGDPALVDLYWFCWSLAFRNLRTPSPGSPFVADYVDEAFSEDRVFQWDTHFMILFWKYAHHVFPAIRSHDNFYRLQRQDGLIAREIQQTDGKLVLYRGRINAVNPPLFAWVEVEWWRATGDDSRFAKVLPVLESYMQWIEKNRKYPEIEHELYWQTNLGAGMDNSPRVGTGWVDLSAQMSHAYSMMSIMADRLGRKAKSERFRARAGEIAERINFSMWHEEDGLYYEIYDTGEHYRVKTVACFWPMLAEIVPAGRLDRLVANLQGPDFWRKVPFPSLAADQPAFHPLGNYWMGGVWAPTNYMIVHGLEINGRRTLAHAAASEYLRAMAAVYRQTGTVWENYSPDEWAPGNSAREDFVGWSGLGPIAMLIESVLGIRRDAPERTVELHPERLDRHGIEGLRLGDTTLSVVTRARAAEDLPPIVDVNTDGSFTLILHHQGKSRVFEVDPGSVTLRY